MVRRRGAPQVKHLIQDSPGDGSLVQRVNDCQPSCTNATYYVAFATSCALPFDFTDQVSSWSQLRRSENHQVHSPAHRLHPTCPLEGLIHTAAQPRLLPQHRTKIVVLDVKCRPSHSE